MHKMGVPVLIVGESGEGKSSMFGQVKDDNGNIIIEGLEPEKTFIMNTENKLPPFENAKDFRNKVLDSVKKIEATLDMLIDSGEGKLTGDLEKFNYKFDNVVFDSFTSLTEIVERYTDFAYRGFERWKNYNTILVGIIVKIKKLKQQVFVVAIPEQKDIGFNQTKSYARVKGKELKFGWLEKEFSIVLFTNTVYDEETGEMIDVELMYHSNKNNTAKSPKGLFKKRPRNDAKIVKQAIQDFYGNEETEVS